MKPLRPVSVVFATILLFALWTPAGSSELIRLTTSPAVDRHPSWSAGDDFVVFASNRSGRFHLYRIPVAGGAVEQLTFGDLDDMYAEVSPDGSMIVFARGPANPHTAMFSSGIFVLPISGGTPVELVPDTGQFNWHPTWSPDGLSIYYANTSAFNEDIRRVPSTGGSSVIAVNLGLDTYPKISPSGTQILLNFRSSWGALNIAETALANPTALTVLTHELQNTTQSTYSPDGMTIAYVSRKVLGRLDMYEMDRGTGISRRLTFDAESSPFDPYSQFPEYSHAGTHIAFSSARVYGDHNIWILETDPAVPLKNELVVGNAQGLPGGASVPVSIHMETTDPVPAMEFKIQDDPDDLTVVGLTVKGRASHMTASHVTNGEVHVLLYNPTGGMIPAGAGVVLQVLMDVEPGARMGETIAMEALDVVVSDPDGNPVEMLLTAGSFLVARLTGDLNGDNQVDVGDLVRLVEIILGTGHPASSEELTAADCNTDEEVNALDVVCLTDAILNGPPPADPTDPASAEVELVFQSDVPVRGIQFDTLPHLSPPVGTEELSPLTLFVQRDRKSVLAFDPKGGEWEPGKRIPMTVSNIPRSVRAYGPGGKALAVEISGNEVRIGTPIGPGLRLLAPSPNPFRASTVLTFTTDVPTTVRTRIFDLRGRMVTEYPEQSVLAGSHTIPWDAKDMSGRSLPAGIYFAVVDAGVRRASMRLTLLGN